MIKCEECMNHYGNIIRRMDKTSMIEVWPAYAVNEDWEHVALFEKNKEK